VPCARELYAYRHDHATEAPEYAPRLVVMTELAWRRISAGDGGAPAMPDVSPQTDAEPAEVNGPPMKRPTPTIVSETIRALRLAGTTVRVPVLVRSLRDQTGCSRASAYRAIHDALAAATADRADGGTGTGDTWPE